MTHLIEALTWVNDEAVLHFVDRLLYGNFFTDEPMSKILNLTDGVKRDPGYSF